MRFLTRYLSPFVVVILMPVCATAGGVFGELSTSVSGTYPQGTFNRYADPGFGLNLRVTAHIPEAEFLAGWLGFGFVEFSSDNQHFNIVPEDDRLPIIRLNQTTAETMVGGQLGFQVGNTTRRAFFRPRAAAGIGFYHFETNVNWSVDGVDTTITIDHEDIDSQTRLGYRIIPGSDFFVTPQIGVMAEFIYDHVWKLNQSEIEDEPGLTSRFQGFAIGAVYMFEAP